LNGCSLPGVCVSCPSYTPPICAAGQRILSGGADTNGCPLPGRCATK
jgi:hypothetical protein